MEAIRRQKRSWIENRIHDESGDLGPGALEAFLGPLGGQFLIKNRNENEKPKKKTNEERTKNVKKMMFPSVKS